MTHAQRAKVRRHFNPPKLQMEMKLFRDIKLIFGAAVLHCKYFQSADTFTNGSKQIFSNFRYNLTTGQYPFEGDNIYRLLENIGKNQWIAPDWFLKLDDKLANLTIGMLQADPNKRLTVQQIKHHQ